MAKEMIETCDIHQYLREHPLLAQLIGKSNLLFECYGDAPAPSKDYGQIQILVDKVIVRWWRITLRNIEGSLYPGEIKSTYADFYQDEIAQREIRRIFGEQTLQYCLHVVCGQIDWFSRLPLDLQIQIFSYLNLEDIPQLALVSKFFRSICRHNDLWKLFYIRQHGRIVLNNEELIHLAEKRGWRHVFFTNRLKLQMELRREAQLKHHHPEDPSDFIKAKERLKQSSIRRHSSVMRKSSPIPNE